MSNDCTLITFFLSCKKRSSPYINRFLSPDTIIPDPSNPQDLNRFSYVRNNPIRYNDPTGHMCSDPDDPSPSCDGSGSYPVNQAPLPSAQVVINNPGPLDDGQEQDDPTLSTTPDVTLLPTITINWNAVFDPLAWEHIVGGILGGIVVAGFGAMIMIPMGADLCVSVVGCAAGIPLVIAGGGAILGGGALIWSGVKFTEVYFDEIFVTTHE